MTTRSPRPPDRILAVERRGIEAVPDAERTARPRELALVFAGVQLGFGALLTGALPLAAGLGPHAAIAALVIGNVLGAIGVAAMAPIGIATGSNVTVASAAAFGMRGRYLGSAITQAIDLGYVALTLVLAVPAIDAAIKRLFLIPTGPDITIATMAGTALLTIAFALFGHATIVAAQKLNIGAGSLVVASLVWFACHSSAPIRHAPAHHATATTLFLAATAVQFANALSWAPYVGDAARYVSPNADRTRAAWIVMAGMTLGALVSTGAGLAIASSVADPADMLGGMIGLLPLWAVVPVVVLGTLGNASIGSVILYNGILDLQAVLWRRSRVVVAIAYSTLATAVGFGALVAFGLAGALDTMCVVVGLLVTPWLCVIIVAYADATVPINPDHLRDFARTDPANPYWRSGGIRWRAVAAWAAGAASGLAVHMFGRLDAGVPVAAAGAVFAYLALHRARA